MHKCDICNGSSDQEDVVHYGEWMIKQNVRVHYYCLLLSTNLPQRGDDSSGILGFLLRDIRREISAAQKRKCTFCNSTGASIACHICGIVFHLACGMENHCISHFCDQFFSYCEGCAPLNSYQRELLANPPTNTRCDICFRGISSFALHSVAYGDCCRKGFAHRQCMRRYALASGYYLRCLWCREEKFHDTIKLQSVFVPDRDATWERQRNAYSELHKKFLSCDQPNCICPQGREYSKKRWTIWPCILCAATGTHLKCRLDTLTSDFKCNFCKEVEQKLIHTKGVGHDSNQSPQSKSNGKTTNEQIDSSFYLPKLCSNPNMAIDDDSPAQTDEEISDEASIITVVRSQSLPPYVDSPIVSTQLNTPSSAAISVIELSNASQQLLSSVPQPPLLLYKSFNTPDHFYLVVYDYNEQDSLGCTGSCTLRFERSDDRIQNLSERALQQLQLKESDIWFRDSDRGIYEKMDQYANQ